MEESDDEQFGTVTINGFGSKINDEEIYKRKLKQQEQERKEKEKYLQSLQAEQGGGNKVLEAKPLLADKVETESNGPRGS